MAPSRSEYVMRNASVTLAMQVLKNLIGFVGRTVFIQVLGAEYLGVNGLFTDILTVLSLAELGIGNAMVFSLYKPLAEKDIPKIKSLMRLYAQSYRAIGLTIAVLGACMIPFLGRIVGEVDYVKENITVLYCLYLLNSVLSYFYAYKKSLIIADQKSYLIEIFQQIFYAGQVAVQSAFLLWTRQFLPYLIIVVCGTLANNLFVSHQANKMYPFLTDKDVEPLPKAELTQIVRNIKALVVYKVGNVVVEGTDSIFVSVLVNVATVGLYDNYKMVVNVFRTVGSQIMNSVTASVGNLNAAGTPEKKHDVFCEMLFVNAWFYGFTAAGLCVFLSELIEVWLGGQFTIGFDAVLAACIYYYVANMHYPCFTFRNTAGLFTYGQYIPIIASVLNIVLDIVLGLRFGLAGILWASTIARVLTYELYDPVSIYRRVFHTGAGQYFVALGGYTALVGADALLCYELVRLAVPVGSFGGLVLRAVVFSVLFNVVFFAATWRLGCARTFRARLANLFAAKLKRCSPPTKPL